MEKKENEKRTWDKFITVWLKELVFLIDFNKEKTCKVFYFYYWGVKNSIFRCFYNVMFRKKLGVCFSFLLSSIYLESEFLFDSIQLTQVFDNFYPWIDSQSLWYRSTNNSMSIMEETCHIDQYTFKFVGFRKNLCQIITNI